jgi:hypothetical protein
LIQAPLPAHVIDKGIQAAGLLAHLMVGNFFDYLQRYRQEKIKGRAGQPIALRPWHSGRALRRATATVYALREEVLADETPVQMLAPGEKNRANVWAYCTTPFSELKAVVYDYSTQSYSRTLGICC